MKKNPLHFDSFIHVRYLLIFFFCFIFLQPGWYSPGRYKVNLVSENLEQQLKVSDPTFEWGQHHFRYWKLMRYAVTKLQPCPKQERENQNLLWNYLEGDHEHLIKNIDTFAPLLNITRDQFGQYPLHHVCCLGVDHLVVLFLEHGADINLVDFEHWTPLHRALRGGHFLIAQLLIKHKANVTATNETLNTPLHYLSRITTKEFHDFQISLAATILEQNGDINAMNSLEETPLMLAVNNSIIDDLPKFLLSKGADPNLRRFV